MPSRNRSVNRSTLFVKLPAPSVHTLIVPLFCNRYLVTGSTTCVNTQLRWPAKGFIFEPMVLTGIAGMF